ncbi:MAG: hypothetical protein ABIJ05_01465 [Patescibacteria group bacterium]
MTLEVEKTTNIFQVLLEEVVHKKGKKVEIVTFAQDTVSGLKKNYSHLGIQNEGELDQALTEFVQRLVPEGETRETLETAFEKDPDRIKHLFHYDEITTEWDTVFNNIIIGIKAVRDQRGESVRTWYLKKV